MKIEEKREALGFGVDRCNGEKLSSGQEVEN